MIAVLLFLLASPLLELGDAQQTGQTCSLSVERLIQLARGFEAWKPSLETWKELSLGNQAEHEVTLKNVVVAAGKVVVRLEEVLELTNVTSRQNVLLQENIDIVKSRLAIAAIFSSVYMILSAVYMVVYMIIYVKKCVKKHQQRIKDEEIEFMDQKLQERRSKRRAVARAKGGSAQQQ